MRPVSEAFKRAVRGSHRMVAEARVVAPGQTGTNPGGVPLTILDGDVQLDGAADVRATLDLTVEGAGMWPDTPSGLLAPYGNEIFVRRGIQFGNGTTEWVSLGYFRIETPEQARPPSGPIRIAGRDRMRGIIDGRMLSPKAFGATATYGATVAALVREVYPWAVIEWDNLNDAAQPLGRSVICEDDRFSFADDLVSSVGKVWAWDHRGVLVVADPPSPRRPVFEVAQGEGGVLVEMSKRLSREGVYNGVIAEGQGTDMARPVREVAIDNDPTSPTYWGGSFGKVVTRYSSALLTHAGKAQAAAQTKLRRSLGVPYSIDFSAVPNPALEPFDPVRVTYGTAGRPATMRSDVHVIDRLTIPLTARAALRASARKQTDSLVNFV